MAETTVTIIKETEPDEEVQHEEDGLKVFADDGVKTALTINSAGALVSQKGTDPSKTYAETGGGLDTTAIHVDEADEIDGITEKTTLDDADILVMEDSAASGVKKKVQVSNLPLGNVDGGSASSTYLTSQVVDGGGA